MPANHAEISNIGFPLLKKKGFVLVIKALIKNVHHW
jgi:hypothetical protein